MPLIVVKRGKFVLNIIDLFVTFKNINNKINPKSALNNKIKNILVSEDIILIRESWNATKLIPINIKIIAFGVFSLISILYIENKI